MLCLFLFGCLRSYGWAANVKNAQFGHNLSTVVIKTNSSNHISTCQIQSLFFFCIQGSFLWIRLGKLALFWCRWAPGRWLQPPSVSPITLQLSALNRFPSHWGWISLGRLNGFSRPLNRFLGIGSNFSHSPAKWWWQELGFNIQPGGHFKEWHCTSQPDI